MDATRTIEVERHDIISGRPFDAVLEAVHGGPGHPKPGELNHLLATTPDWAAYREAIAQQDGVHLRYDTIVSLIGPELQPDARAQAEALDAEVLSLLSAAAAG